MIVYGCITNKFNKEPIKRLRLINVDYCILSIVSYSMYPQ